MELLFLTKPLHTDTNVAAARQSALPKLNSLARLLSHPSRPPSPSSATPRPSASTLIMPVAAWSPPRARVQLKLSRERLRLLQQKKTQIAKATRREVAGLLEKGKLESARIKVEGLLAEDLYVELLEVLELYCELLLARFGLLETVKEIDPGVQEAVAGIIHAAPRTELKEIHILREMLMSKGGRDFAVACIDNENNIVPERITSKLVIQTPPQDLVDLYSYEIAKAYSVEWRPEGLPDSNAPAESEPAATTTTPIPPATPTKTHSIPPFDTVMPVTPPIDPAKADNSTIVRTNLTAAATGAAPPPVPPTPATAPNGGNDKELDAFEALQKRFADLKRR